MSGSAGVPGKAYKQSTVGARKVHVGARKAYKQSTVAALKRTPAWNTLMQKLPNSFNQDQLKLLSWWRASTRTLLCDIVLLLLVLMFLPFNLLRRVPPKSPQIF